MVAGCLFQHALRTREFCQIQWAYIPAKGTVLREPSQHSPFPKGTGKQKQNPSLRLSCIWVGGKFSGSLQPPLGGADVQPTRLREAAEPSLPWDRGMAPTGDSCRTSGRKPHELWSRARGMFLWVEGEGVVPRRGSPGPPSRSGSGDSGPGLWIAAPFSRRDGQLVLFSGALSTTRAE